MSACCPGQHDYHFIRNTFPHQGLIHEHRHLLPYLSPAIAQTTVLSIPQIRKHGSFKKHAGREPGRYRVGLFLIKESAEPTDRVCRQNLGSTKFALSEVPDLTGKVALVTGGSEGLSLDSDSSYSRHPS